MYREKGLNDVCLDGAERLVFDDNEDLLLFFQVDEVTKPGFFGKSVGKDEKEKTVSCIVLCCIHLVESVCLLSTRFASLFNPSIHLSIHSYFSLLSQLWGNGKQQKGETLREMS